MATTPTPILMAITHTPMVIMGLGRGVRVIGVMVDEVIMVLGVRVTGVMVDEVIMVLGVRVTGVMVEVVVLGVRVTGVMLGIADNTFFGKLYYNDVIIPFSTLNDLIGWLGNFWATLLRRVIFTSVDLVSVRLSRTPSA